MFFAVSILIIFLVFLIVSILHQNQKLKQEHKAQYVVLQQTLEDLNQKHLVLLEKSKLINGFCNTCESDIKAIISEIFKLQKICIEMQKNE